MWQSGIVNIKRVLMMSDDGMLNLSEVLMEKQHTMESFYDLAKEVHEQARAKKKRFFRMDVKPPFEDCPDNWEDRLEAAFY